MIIIGIDPGTLKTGYGVINYSNNTYKYISSGVIKTNSKDSLPERLKKINSDLVDIINKYNPRYASIENIFVKNNVKSALLLGQARGAAIVALGLNGKISIFEFSPREIKKAVVGQGGALKDQVNVMVKIFLNIKINLAEDESDALACAICCAHNLPSDKITFNNHENGVRL